MFTKKTDSENPAAIGPHSRLVQSSPLYRHWEYIHFNEFRHEFETE